ncbi:MAG: ExbD/TolR family protein, partial [Thiotrichales bacterium]
AVKVDLPKASSTENESKPEHIQLTLNAAGEVFWNGDPVDDAGWQQRMTDAASQPTPPELHLRADGELAYRKVVKVMSDAAKSGLTKIGFVTEPVDPD